MIRKLLLAGVVLFLSACSAKRVERSSLPPSAFQYSVPGADSATRASSPFLKAHMKNGDLYVFSAWKTKPESGGIGGVATLFDPYRNRIGEQAVTLGYDSVAIIETNELRTSGAGTALTVFTGITFAVAAFCITNPKACFGSCPTFYASDGDSLRLQGEGFSSSIAPSLEASDVDALYRARARDGVLDIVMKNEALETHVVRWVDVLALPRSNGCRVFASTDGEFWESAAQSSPRSAVGPEGDCLAPVRDFDARERISYADEHDLAAKETVDLSFSARPGHSYGLVVACRQSLLPTYLLYQTYAYMGTSVGDWMADIERGKIPAGAADMERLIGGIDVSIQRGDSRWQPIGTVAEHGPLAVDVHLLKLGTASDSTVNIRLQMTKGTWRIDEVALAELSRPVLPVRVPPSRVMKEGEEDPSALEKLRDSAKVLVTLPGDTYTLRYRLPDRNQPYELFIESRGYYLEWIRKEWLAEENAARLAEMFLNPSAALKQLAPEFKRVELSMEDCFWRSRYGKQ